MAKLSTARLFQTGYNQIIATMIALATLAICARVWMQKSLRRRPEPQDYLMYAAHVLFFAMALCDVIGIPRAYEVVDNGKGTSPRYTPQLVFSQYVRQMFAIMLLAWGSQLCVKLSLLALYKNLLARQSRTHHIAWWIVCLFCVMGFIGSVISYLLSCENFGRSMKYGDLCSGPNNLRGIGATLYASTALNISSDVLIMILPMRLTWKLQIPCSQKIALFALFSSGSVCIAVATTRTVHIASGRYSDVHQPLIVLTWTAVETAVAVCIGCCPVYFAAYRARQARRASKDSDRLATSPFSRQIRSQRYASLRVEEAIKMVAVVSSKGRDKEEGDVCLEGSIGSQYAPSGKDTEIQVTNTARC